MNRVFFQSELIQRSGQSKNHIALTYPKLMAMIYQTQGLSLSTRGTTVHLNRRLTPN